MRMQRHRYGPPDLSDILVIVGPDERSVVTYPWLSSSYAATWKSLHHINKEDPDYEPTTEQEIGDDDEAKRESEDDNGVGYLDNANIMDSLRGEILVGPVVEDDVNGSCGFVSVDGNSIFDDAFVASMCLVINKKAN
ncbi:hypothetical protein F443_20839 [Phytophthora nicotianae P1569]|uniref:Uncharacterized protein n=1 Tax=Phytophthora nicotianae P1569 TaxID=1317065 RepID=V9DZP7_PHYNI|nr:hypothetical protein F443_20839 [Phytophthora nicotianae P1569]